MNFLNVDLIDIQKIVEISKLAGKKIMRFYNKACDINHKHDGSPLTIADKNAHTIIVKELKKLFPNTPIISEESKIPEYKIRKDWQSFWLVDPLDGTEEFVNNRNEFTVNIALIQNAEPVLGVVYAPAQDIVYYGLKNRGAFKQTISNTLPLYFKQKNKKEDSLRVVVSRSHLSDATKTHIMEISNKRKCNLIKCGSSLKICFIADGQADYYPRLEPIMEWDIASAHAILKEVGGGIFDYKSGLDLTYNSKTLKYSHFVAYMGSIDHLLKEPEKVSNE